MWRNQNRDVVLAVVKAVFGNHTVNVTVSVAIPTTVHRSQKLQIY
jgi:hypothetical protein